MPVQTFFYLVRVGRVLALSKHN